METAPATSSTSNLSNIENVIGGAGDDMLTGDAKANPLNGGPGDDTLTGGDGNDIYILTRLGADTITEVAPGAPTRSGAGMRNRLVHYRGKQRNGAGLTTFVDIETSSAARRRQLRLRHRRLDLRRRGRRASVGDTVVGPARTTSGNHRRQCRHAGTHSAFTGIENLLGGYGDDTFRSTRATDLRRDQRRADMPRPRTRRETRLSREVDLLTTPP